MTQVQITAAIHAHAVQEIADVKAGLACPSFAKCVGRDVVVSQETLELCSAHNIGIFCHVSFPKKTKARK